MPHRTIETTFGQKALLVLCSSTLILLLACAGELYCRWFTRINLLGISRDMFVSRMFGGSYGNRPDYHGIAFGADVQTDANGFRIDPTFRDQTGDNAVLILGDLVAFGAGVDPAQTFVGLMQRSMPRVRFFNSAVIGYCLHDYANVVRQFVPMRPDIKYALLFYSLNNIYETSAEQILKEVAFGRDRKSLSSLQSLAFLINDYLRSRSKLYLYTKDAFTDPPLRHFEADLPGYKKGIDDVDASLKPLAEIAMELTAKDVSFEVFIMPYQAQVRAKQQAYLLPQQLVGGFLRRNGITYYDASDAFMKSHLPVAKLYLYGDPTHLSEEGHQLVSQFVDAELTKMMRPQPLAN